MLAPPQTLGTCSRGLALPRGTPTPSATPTPEGRRPRILRGGAHETEPSTLPRCRPRRDWPPEIFIPEAPPPEIPRSRPPDIRDLRPAEGRSAGHCDAATVAHRSSWELLEGHRSSSKAIQALRRPSKLLDSHRSSSAAIAAPRRAPREACRRPSKAIEAGAPRSRLGGLHNDPPIDLAPPDQPPVLVDAP